MHTWNPWHGCTRYSEGCAHCYMYYLDCERGQDGSVIRRVKTGLNLPIKKTRQGTWKVPAGTELMVCMTSDFFLPEADAWRAEAWEMMRARPDLTFWLQTKRAALVQDRLPPDWGDGWPHVKLCFTAENQTRADERIPILLSIPCHYKAVMCAPMLTAVDLSPYLQTGQIRAVLADGENYDGDRPCHYEWVKSLHDQCARYGVNFTFVGTGNVFVKDGKTYHIPKAYQRVQARRAGLDLPPSSARIPIQKRCATCPSRDRCNGCRQCRRCDGRRTLEPMQKPASK